MGMYVNSNFLRSIYLGLINSNFLRSILGLRIRPKNEYDKKIIFSLIASLLVIVLPFLPLWQWDFVFDGVSKTFVQYLYLNSAFNYRGYTWVWVIFILIGALGIFLLLLLSPQNKRETVKVYNKLMVWMLYFILFGLIFGLLLTSNIFGLAVMIEAPALWITLTAITFIGVFQVRRETWEKIRRDMLAYIFILPTVGLMIFIFYIPILLSLFISFQNAYSYPINPIIFLTQNSSSVGFSNYTTIIIPQADNGTFSFDLVFTIILWIICLGIATYCTRGSWSLNTKLRVGGGALFGIAIFVTAWAFLLQGRTDLVITLGLIVMATLWVLISVSMAQSTNDTFKKIAMYILIIIPILVLVTLTNIFLAAYTNITNQTSAYISFLQPAPLVVLNNTIVWTFGCVIAHIIIGLTLALLMNAKFPLRSIARALLIVPWAVPSFITVTIIGIFILTPGTGMDNIMAVFHFQPFPWYSNNNILLSCILVNIWLGYSFVMVALLAALQSVNKDLYEAAELDGASSWQRFRHITLPMIKPVLIVTSILGFMWTFNMFNVIYLITRPNTSIIRPQYFYILIVYVFYLFYTTPYNWSYAATLSFLLFILLIVLTKIYTKIAGKGPYDVD